MNGTEGATSGIGRPVRRKEDFRLLTGRGSFVDDLAPAGLTHAVIVRSPYAHARIVGVDKAAASAALGVLAVLSGTDYLADGLAAIPHNAGLMGPPDLAVRLRGGAPIATRHYPMPADIVRFVGEPVALVLVRTEALRQEVRRLEGDHRLLAGPPDGFRRSQDDRHAGPDRRLHEATATEGTQLVALQEELARALLALREHEHEPALPLTTRERIAAHEAAGADLHAVEIDAQSPAEFEKIAQTLLG